MKYLWTEDTGAGLHFWKLVDQLFFDDKLSVESKGSNRYSYVAYRFSVACMLY